MSEVSVPDVPLRVTPVEVRLSEPFEAMAGVASPVDAHPSLTDVRRRARRHNRRRITATVGAVACTGVATATLIIRRDSTDPAAIGQSDSTNQTALPVGESPTTAISGTFVGATSTFPTTTMAFEQVTIDASLVWNALANLPNDPSATGFAAPPTDADPGQMPTAAMFGCDTDTCASMFNYVVWHELARALGFLYIQSIQGYNPGIDFSQLPREGDVLQMSAFAAPPQTTVYGETTTTVSLFEGVTVIDGGAPEGAMEDAYQRLAGYNRTIVPSAGKSVEHTMVMPIGNNTSIALAIGGLLGIAGLDTWDPSLVSAPVEGLVVVVIGPDYWGRVQAGTPATTSTTIG